MTPTAFAKAIIVIEKTYGLRLEPRSAWLRLDGARSCDVSSGWHGTIGDCERRRVATSTLRVSTGKAAELAEDKSFKGQMDREGHPDFFRTVHNGKTVDVYPSESHDPSWAQNDAGIRVSAQKSRGFESEQNPPLNLPPAEFKRFIENVKKNKAYENVEEFRIGSVFDDMDKRPGFGKDFIEYQKKAVAQMKGLEAAGLVTITRRFSGNPLKKDRTELVVTVNFDKKGNIVKAPKGDSTKQLVKGYANAYRDRQAALMETMGFGDDAKWQKQEADVAAKVASFEDKVYDRKPRKTATESEYTKKAEAWAKSQGFKNDENGVNGFTAKQAAKHDIAHPATHDLVGLDSKALNNYFGGLKTKSGKPSLLGEEAIVNAVEHLSRGDSVEASVMSGVRVARMLSRDSTEQERKYVRSPRFVEDLSELTERAVRNNDYGSISKVVRESNWESGTVTQRGNS